MEGKKYLIRAKRLIINIDETEWEISYDFEQQAMTCKSFSATLTYKVKDFQKPDIWVDHIFHSMINSFLDHVHVKRDDGMTRSRGLSMLASFISSSTTVLGPWIDENTNEVIAK